MKTIRQVGLWYYFITGLGFIIAVYLMGKKRLLRFGLLLLSVGILLNALWEALLFTVWTRYYLSPVPLLLQSIYHSLTEFGPLLVILVIVFSQLEILSIEQFKEASATGIHSWTVRFAVALFGIWGLTLAIISLTANQLFSLKVQVIREINLTFFIAESSVALLVLIISWFRRNRTALKLFLLVGTLNTGVEILGVLLGNRIYVGVPPFTALVIGFGEGGTAAALVWLLSEQVSDKLSQ